MDDPLIRSLTTAVEAAPEDVALRVHLAELLLAGGRTDDAVRHAAAALAVDPASEPAMGGPTSPADDADRAAQAGQGPARPGFDWDSAEAELGDVVPPMFSDGSTGDVPGDPSGTESLRAFDVQRERVTLADVGGLD